MIRHPSARGMPISAGASTTTSTEHDQSEYVSASANVATAAELRARMLASRATGDSRKKSHRQKRQGTGLAVDTTMQPFNMDGDTADSDDSPSDGSSDMMSPNSPCDKRLPFFNKGERNATEEVAASWSYMPQNADAGMPRIRPQQPALQEAAPSSKVTPLSFGVSTSSSSVSGSCGDSTPTTPRHRRHKHRPKDDSNSGADSVQKSPLSALTFGNPKGDASVSPLADSLGDMSLNDSAPSAKGPTIEIRVRSTPKKEHELSSSKEKLDPLPETETSTGSSDK